MVRSGNHRTPTYLILAVLSLPIVGYSTSAPAAETNDTTRPALEEIVVTAERRAESINTVPVSIAVLSGQDLEDMGAKDLKGFAGDVPGLAITGVGDRGDPLIAIRGIASGTGAATTGIYIDDTPVQMRADPFQGNPDPRLFDIERIEVLRGPQGTLYGASSEGGTIRYITPQPSLTGYSGHTRAAVETTVGGDPSFEVGGAGGGPILQNTLGVRASFFDRREGGYVDRVSPTTGEVVENNSNHSNAFSGRLAFRIAPTESLEITPAVFYQDVSAADLPYFFSTLGPFKDVSAIRQPYVDHFVLPSLRIGVDLGPVEVVSVTSYFNRRDTESSDYATLIADLVFGTPFIPGHPNMSVNHVDTTQESFSQELRVASTRPGPWQWTLGVFYQNTQTHQVQHASAPDLDQLVPAIYGGSVEDVLGFPLLPGGDYFFGDSRVVEKQTSGFGEVTYQLTRKLKATAGARISKTSTGSSGTANGFINGGLTTVPFSEEVETPVTPRFNLAYQVTDSDLIYASAAKGFRVGGPNAPVPAQVCAADLAANGLTKAPDRFDSDSVWSYEIGTKDRFSHRLSVNSSVFWIRWEGIQQFIPFPGCGYGFTGNLGTATSKGFDLEARAIVGGGITLDGTAGYTHAALNQSVLGGVNPSTGMRAIIANEGDLVQQVPLWTYSAAANYDFALGAAVAGYLRAEYQYTGSYRRTPGPGTSGYDPLIFHGEAVSITNMRVGLRFAKLNAALYVNNLLDRRPVTYATDQLDPISKTFLQEMSIRPRTIGLEADYAF